MRLWSLDPTYLDWKGLGGVWREALLAQAVLLGRTRGWKNHSQLLRFKNHSNPINAIGFYLLKIHEEAQRRGYTYNRSKIVAPTEKVRPITITTGQLMYEFNVLKNRLRNRSPEKYQEVVELERDQKHPRPHPLFLAIEGDVEQWEKSYWKAKEGKRDSP